MSAMQHPPSPEATTTAILGASSAGWSPQRSSRRAMPSTRAGDVTPSDLGGSEQGSPSRMTMPEHRANLGALRSHGLVSNSIFKSSGGNPSPNGSQASPSFSSPSQRRSPQLHAPVSPDRSQRTGFGLGISAAGTNATSPAKAYSVKRSTSNNSIQSNGSGSDIENDTQVSHYSRGSPRKSTNFRRLEQANYVSNSPFRKGGAADGTSFGMDLTPNLPDNAYAMNAVSTHSSRSQDEERISTSAKPTERIDEPSAMTSHPARPQTPEGTPQRLATAIGQGEMDFSTPMSNSTPRGIRRTPNADSPSSRGLLVSNRLHGPRQMDGSTGSAANSPHDSPTKRERRKTVTFDEILDVQEFDRESSFDRESLQSGSSDASSLNGGGPLSREASSDDEVMWLHRDASHTDHGAQEVVERLMVVNGSPDTQSSAFSTPDLDMQARLKTGQPEVGFVTSNDAGNDNSSNDSRDLSSIDEPQSPPGEELSIAHSDDKSYGTAMDASLFRDPTYAEADSDVSGGNLSAYGALHRVESMVDELLGDELLEGHTAQSDAGAGARRPSMEPTDSPPRRRRNMGPKIGQKSELKAQPVQAQKSPEVSSNGQKRATDMTLSLPEWSPLMQDDVSLEPTGRNEGSAETAVQGRPNGRPHISRDAVLQRVAREKKLLEVGQRQESQSRPATDEKGGRQDTSPTRPQVLTSSRRSEPDQTRNVSKREDLTDKPNMMIPIPAPMAPPMRQVASDEQRSPLERLSAEVAAEQRGSTATSAQTRPQSPTVSSTDHAVKRQQEWFGGSSREGTPEAEAKKPAGEHSEGRSTSGEAETSNAEARLSAPMLGLTPAQQAEQIIARRRSKNGKSPLGSRHGKALDDGQSSSGEGSARAEGQEDVLRKVGSVQRSKQESDPTSDRLQEEMLRQKHLLDSTLKGAVDHGFESGLQREISRIYRQGDAKYRVKDRGVYAHDEAPVGQSSQTGRADRTESGKAWRKLRRPSDMNEYTKEVREYRAKENPKKVAGKVFVLVDSFTPSALPVPARSTRFYCVLDNGLHVVRTATAGLRSNGPSKIGQEFELIQHKNLTFSLTLVVQRDTHLQEPSEQSPASAKRERLTPSFSRGVGKLFSSPKKRTGGGFGTSTTSLADQAPTAEPMLAFLNREGAFGQSEVVFEKVAHDCLAKCHIVDLPVHGVNDPPAPPSISTGMPNGMSRSANSSADFSRNLGKVRGTLRLKIFYLPPIPGVAKALLPENLSDCIRGMEAARWHAGQPWMEGTLTQLGGDCQSWRRRPVKAQGAHLIGFNEITKKPTVKIDLSKAVSIEENNDPLKNASLSDEEMDETYHVERSFRITFRDGERIFFFADSDEEMHRWLDALSKIVGNSQIPPQCIWAQVALEMLKSTHSSSSSSSSKADLGSGSAKRISTYSATGPTSSSTRRVPVPTTLNEEP